MPQFFIDRPVFAWVLAILIMLAGVLAIVELPAEAYPEIAPPQVNISTFYPGADAATIERTVTQVIEQQLTGLDRLLYFTSSSNSDGSASITLTFETGTDADIAAVQTQNRVALATPRLPAEVIEQGVVTSKSTAGFLVAIAIRSEDGALDSGELNNLLASRVLDQIQRIPGVGSANQFGSEYAMRIWLSPDRLHAYGLSASQVLKVIRDQNVQFASGSIGSDPAVTGQKFSAPVIAEGRFTSTEEFENIILRAEPGGSTVKLKDVARIALGPFTYGFDVRLHNRPVAGFGVQLLPGANGLDVAKRVKEKMAELAQTFPAGVAWSVVFDSTTFIVISIREVLYTLIAAVVLVFIVMLVFLQNIRATLIPTLVVPAALMGAFVGMYAAGFSINQLSLFGMVLAIGIVVDDAIVVIEAVERIMREEGLSPREATRKAMGQITGAIVTITVVLAAVFVPSALQTGATGAIYRQFALTIAVSMLFSAFLALSFTPALCAHMLKPAHLEPNFVFRWFNRVYNRSQRAYGRVVAESLRHTPRWIAAFAVLVIVGAFLFTRLPGSFVPEEDQGYSIGIVQLPPGAALNRTMDVMSQMSAVIGSQGGARRFPGRRIQLHRPGRERRHHVHSPEALGRPQGERQRVQSLGQRGAVGLDQGRDGVRRQSADDPWPGQLRRFRFLPRGPRRQGPRSAHGCSESPAFKGSTESSGRQRHCQHARRRAASRNEGRSRAGAVHGAVGERRVRCHPHDARARLRQRFLLPGSRPARDGAGGRAVPHGPGSAWSHLFTVHARHDLRREQRRFRFGHGLQHDSGRQRRARPMGCRPTEHCALQRLPGGRDHRSAWRGRQLRRGNDGNAAHRAGGAAGGLWLRLGRPVTAGSPLRGAGPDAVPAVDSRGLPVPRGALRELGDAARRDADRAPRCAGRDPRGDVAGTAE